MRDSLRDSIETQDWSIFLSNSSRGTAQINFKNFFPVSSRVKENLLENCNKKWSGKRGKDKSNNKTSSYSE